MPSRRTRIGQLRARVAVAGAAIFAVAAGAVTVWGKQPSHHRNRSAAVTQAVTPQQYDEYAPQQYDAPAPQQQYDAPAPQQYDAPAPMTTQQS